MLGVAQLLLGEALLDAGASEMLAQMIQLSGGGTIALGIYFLLFLARHESEFAQAYSKAEKMVLEVNPDTGQKELIDDSPKALKAAWYALPIGMTFIGLMAWLGA
jgi:hypothetical protein